MARNKENKKNLIARIQQWMDSVPGQTFMNYAYGWGASIVVLGMLFKLMYFPGANAMIFIGMCTEAVVFFISGFERPAGLREMEDDEDNDYDESDEEDEVLNENEQLQTAEANSFLDTSDPEAQPVVVNRQPVCSNAAVGEQDVVVTGGSTGYVQSGPIINGTVPVSGTMGAAMPDSGQASQTVTGSGQATTAQQPAFDVKMLADMVNASNAEFLKAARQSCAPEMEEAAAAYVEELKTLTETLSRVSLQAESLTRDSKEMDNLNRVLVGINSIYEVQLKSISTQIGTIDQINEQTRKMARQIEELNGIYSRMIKALTVNMKNAPGNASTDQF